MPSTNLPSSFASAAAGQNANRDRGSGRGDVRGSGSGEWSRRDGRSNGTLTFRRSSTTPFGQGAAHQTTEPSAQPPASETSAPSHLPAAGAFDPSQPSRYSRDQLLDIFKSQDLDRIDVTSLFVPGWNPGHVNGNSGRGWGKPSDAHPQQDASACWDTDGQTAPIGLVDMSPEEKELFSSDVNSPLKQQQNKDAGQAGALNGRKTSVSHGSAYGMSSPSTASRPGTRRRETTDTNPFPSAGVTSPTGNGRFPRDENSSVWLGRKGAEVKDAAADEPDEDTVGGLEPPIKSAPFSGLMRSNTAGSTGFAASSSLWGAAAPPPAAAPTGAFGNFALPAPTTAADKRFGSTRGESRLAHLIPKDSSESIGGKAAEGPNADLGRSWRARPRTDTDPFGADEALSGSAVLGGAQDTSPPPLPQQGQGYQAFDTPVKGSAGDFGMSGLNLGEGRGSASPSQTTNPYRSPPVERGGDEHDDPSFEKQHEHASNFGSIGRGFGNNAFDGSDRSQTSSVGAKGYPPLNNLTGWPAGASAGTPDRDRPPFASAFGSSLFSPISDLQSPNLSGLGGVFGPGSTGGIGGSGSLRGSKLGSLFPAAMQAQMQSQDQESLSDSVPDLRQINPLGAIGRGPVGSQARDTDSPMRAGRGAFEDLFPSSESMRSPGLFTTADPSQTLGAATTQSGSFTPTSSAPPQTSGDLPPSQARTMVMPDRMRWVYLDPQGQMQGPFTGLEMNDWYKANFFTADLRVKKVEDPEFEPLGQLIRRIGNSREPFLVPQIGIAHGPPSQVGPFSSGDSRGIIPPLMGVIPSFGRTLTAEEQNNLERRKQEEQYMMARQREFLAHQQAVMKMQIGGTGTGALHHHSSAQSLQSQPSFGSMTSPIGMAPQPPLGTAGANTGFFDGSSGAAQESGQAGASSGNDIFRPEDLNAQERHILASLSGPGGITGAFPPQPVGAPPGDMNIRGQLPGVDQLQRDSQGFSARLKEFQELRAQRDAEDAQFGPPGALGTLTEDPDRTIPTAQADAAEVIKEITQAEMSESQEAMQQSLSLTQQVQKAQSAAIAASQQVQSEDVWAKPAASSGFPMPFPPPPPQSTTPLPAPTAQRARSNLPDQYASRSRSETPDSVTPAAAAQPPPLAPWARDPTETQRGPSLKEIQEAEAKKAAKAEEVAAAARRAAMEQEAAAAREREKAAPEGPALPTSSTWGNGSPVSGTSTMSPWTKPGTAKAAPGLVSATAATPVASGSKKTLADIQREEEARKQKARELAAAQGGVASPNSAMGKRYAELASKTGSAATATAAAGTAGIAPPPGSGWSTVGAGGRVKVPTGPAAQTRTVSAAAVKPVQAPIVRPAAKPVASVVKSDMGSAALDEFSKWLHRELARGITGGIDIESFASTLLILPLDQQIIQEAVYANSTTMDGRHFAEEFIRRKKLADRGVIEKQPTPSNDTKASSSAGGWSEVAKKGGPTQTKESEVVGGAGFKVVPGRKKGKK